MQSDIIIPLIPFNDSPIAFLCFHKASNKSVSSSTTKEEEIIMGYLLFSPKKAYLVKMEAVLVQLSENLSFHYSLLEYSLLLPLVALHAPSQPIFLRL